MIKELIIKNRSYRGFDESRKVTEKELLEMIDCARYTASSANIQPIKYFIAFEEEQVKKIQDLTNWAMRLKDIQLPHEGKMPRAFIVICIDNYIAKSPDFFLTDLGIVAQSILLSATESGLGGCMIGNFDSDKLSEQLKLQDNIKPMLLVAIGKPDEKIVLTEVYDNLSTAYYRDENDIHYVPKRALEDIVINMNKSSTSLKTDNEK